MPEEAITQAVMGGEGEAWAGKNFFSVILYLHADCLILYRLSKQHSYRENHVMIKNIKMWKISMKNSKNFFLNLYFAKYKFST